jgi:hypothetical protein
MQIPTMARRFFRRKITFANQSCEVIDQRASAGALRA